MLNVDLTSEDFFRDPRPQLRRLREAGPVVEVKLPILGRIWMATTQETASRVLKDGATFASLTATLSACAGGCQEQSEHSPATC